MTVTDRVPDAWDECVACGHDRDDHALGRCGALLVGDRTCHCDGFLPDRPL